MSTGDIVVGIVIVSVVAMAILTILKSRKKGGCCGCSKGSCDCCSSKPFTIDDKQH